MGADVSDAEYCHNELDNTLLSAHIITSEYIAHYNTSLLILLRNVQPDVNLIANAILATSLRNALY